MEVRPATVFADVATVIGPKRPDASVCFCLSHRIPAKLNRELVGEQRGEYVRRLCGQDPAPGVLAYDGAEAVGWAGIAPRSATQFARSTVIPVVDDLPVWSLWCIRVKAGRRGRGTTAALIEGAVAFAAEHGAPAVEAYPLDNLGAKVNLTMAFAGLKPWFDRAGFETVAPTASTLDRFPRVLMRRTVG